MKKDNGSLLSRNGMAVSLVCMGVLSFIACGSQGPTGKMGKDGSPGPVTAPVEYVKADGLAGGAAYSTWFGKYGGGKGSESDYGLTVSEDFARCKSCHAWDGKGNNGSYADRTGQSTGKAMRADVSSVDLRATVVASTPDQLFDLIASPSGRPLNVWGSAHPDYTAVLTNEQIWSIVKFMREEWVNPNDLYSLSVSGAAVHYVYSAATTAWVLKKPTLTFSQIGKNGDATRGKSIFSSKCVSCHGATGETILLEDDTMSLGEFVRSKPHEAWFKMKFGNGAASMQPGLVTTTTDLKDLYKAFTNITAFPDHP